MDTKKLRQKILDLAIHGKLVPQDSSDEPASVLLERIHAEKEQLVKEGKIKPSRSSKTTARKQNYNDNNGPWKLPEGWVWTTLGEIGNWQAGATPSRLVKEYYGGEIPWLKTGDLNDDFITYIPEKITQKALDETSLKLNPEGSILIAMYGATIGKLGILTFPATTNQACCACSHCYIEKLYLFYFLLANRENFIAEGGGGAQPNISKEKIVNTRIPIPPSSEQCRIIKEIKKYFDEINVIETNISELKSRISEIKNMVLNLAINGKLVPQDPNDESASELLKRINPNIKITSDMGHYQQLPNGWSSCLLRDICININGLWKGKKAPFCNIGVIRNANFTKDFKIDFSNIEYIDVEDSALAKRKLENGDLIIEKSGGSENNPVGRAVLYEGEDGKYSFSNFTMALRIENKKVIYPKFLYFFLLKKYLNGDMKNMQTQTTGLHNLILSKFMDISLFIPPYNEQLRIVDKLEYTLNILSNIEKCL